MNTSLVPGFGSDWWLDAVYPGRRAALLDLMAKARQTDQFIGVYNSAVDQLGDQDGADRVGGFIAWRRNLGDLIIAMNQLCQDAMRALNEAHNAGAVTDEQYEAALPAVEREGLGGLDISLADICIILAGVVGGIIAAALIPFLGPAFMATYGTVTQLIAVLAGTTPALLIALRAAGATIGEGGSAVLKVGGGVALVIGALALLAFARSRNRAA